MSASMLFRELFSARLAYGWLLSEIFLSAANSRLICKPPRSTISAAATPPDRRTLGQAAPAGRALRLRRLAMMSIYWRRADSPSIGHVDNASPSKMTLRPGDYRFQSSRSEAYLALTPTALRYELCRGSASSGLALHR